MKSGKLTETGGSFPDIVANLANAGRLSEREQIAALKFVRDLANAQGRSGGLVSAVTERVQSSRKSTSPGTAWTDADVRMQRIVDGLGETDRAVYAWLVTAREQARPSLADFGRRQGGYTDTHMATGLSVGMIKMLLGRIADLYDEVEGGERFKRPKVAV